CRLPTKRLKIVLLPTFGRPTTATTGKPAWARAREGMAEPYAAPVAGVEPSCTKVGRLVVRPAGVAAPATASPAAPAAGAAAAGGGAGGVGGMWGGGGGRGGGSSIGGEVPPVIPTTSRPSNTDASSRSFQLSIWMAGLPAIPTSRVSSLVFALERPPTTTIRS